MEALVAINRWVGASETEGHQDLQLFTENLELFFGGKRKLSWHIYYLLLCLYPVLDKACLAKALNDMC